MNPPASRRNAIDPAVRLLLEVWHHPERLAELTPPDWEILIALLRRHQLLGRLAAKVTIPVPAQVQDHFTAALLVGREHARQIRWEINRIQRALRDLPTTLLLLKGAAYLFADLPMARGRLVADVDLLVPEEQLASVEAALVRQGWYLLKTDPYDQHYYRQWMHELPPLRHRDRWIDVDIHHAWLPRFSRLTPDPRQILASAIRLPETNLWIPAREDLVLHSVVQLFHDSDLQNGLRDLADLDELLRHFGSEPGFWSRLQARAVELGVTRPCFHAARYLTRYFATPVPLEWSSASWAPPFWQIAGMDWLVAKVLLPSHPDRRTTEGGLAQWAALGRSHWLKMPPRLLARHLGHQGWVRLKTLFSALEPGAAPPP